MVGVHSVVTVHLFPLLVQTLFGRRNEYIFDIWVLVPFLRDVLKREVEVVLFRRDEIYFNSCFSSLLVY